MTKFKLKSPFLPCGDQPKAIEKITKSFRDGEKYQTLLGVTGSGKTFTMANIIQNLGKKTLILAPNKTLAAQLYGEFREFFPENAVEYFVSYYDYYRPEAYVVNTDTYIEKDAAINDEIDKLRHSTTKNLLERDDVIVIASVSCIYGIGSPDDYKEQRLVLFQDQEIDRDDLLNRLSSMQYLRNDIEFSRGKFRVRGDLVEIFPAYEDANILRLEFFDNVLENISTADPLTGKVIGQLSKTTLYPSSHYVVSEQKMENAISEIRKELRQRIQEFESEGKILEKERLQRRTLYDLEMLEEMGHCSGIENYSRHFSDQNPGEAPYTLIDFFNNDFLFIVDESHLAIPQVGGMYRGDYARKKNLVDHGFRLPCALDNRPLKFEEFEKKLNKVLFVSATPSSYELQKTGGEFVEQIIRPTGLLDPVVEMRDSTNQVDDLLAEARKVIKNGNRVLITTLTKKLAEDLTLYYQGLGLKIKYLHSDIDTIQRVEILNELRDGTIDILVGINLLREGLDLPEVELVAIMDADKEGFLRSFSGLIQTIGRAARNGKGKAILYGIQKTLSMHKAMSETNRRREIQNSYNIANNIIPQTIKKEIRGGLIEVLGHNKQKSTLSKYISKKDHLSIEEIDKQIIKMKDHMKQLARELRFEEAAKVRDEIKILSELRLLV